MAPAPNRAAVLDGPYEGHAAHRLDDSVNTREGRALGSHRYRDTDPTIRQDRGLWALVKPGVKFHDLLVVPLGVATDSAST